MNGIEKIVHKSGKLHPVPENAIYLLLEPEVTHSFEIEKGFGDTSIAQNDQIVWQLRNISKDLTLKRCTKINTAPLSLVIRKKLCGLTRFYLRAEPVNAKKSALGAGIYLCGLAKPLITSAFWTKSAKGPKFEGTLKYGELVYLHGETEGLNGHSFVVEVYFAKSSGEADFLVSSYTTVKCIHGEFDVFLTDTLNWASKFDDTPPAMANFLIKIRPSSSDDVFYKDASGSPFHAKFLRIENQINEEKPASDTNQTFQTS